ncbi:hypothetical protein [Streptomyces chartreusis]|uniref:hypothetical protein n=1 Tax=Streptomyces chartreusis TaxID=1969 RepID=UPI002E185AAC
MTTATTAAESVTAQAALRVAASEAPARFKHLVHTYADDMAHGRTIEAPPRLDEDGVLVAAYVEALAGIRRLRAQAHPLGCFCDACRVHAHITSHRRYDQ